MTSCPGPWVVGASVRLSPSQGAVSGLPGCPLGPGHGRGGPACLAPASRGGATWGAAEAPAPGLSGQTLVQGVGRDPAAKRVSE